MDTLVYDIEIARTVESTKKGWASPKDLCFASAVAYSYDKDRYYFFLHLSGLTQLIALLNKNKVATFNGIRFDSKVILGNKRIIKNNGKKAGVFIAGKGVIWEEYDLFVQCLKFVHKCKNDMEACKKMSPGGMKLDDICKATIGMKKTGNGADAPILYQKRLFDDLLEYNFNDVRITKKLYDFIFENKYVLDKNKNKIRIPYVI
jgi:hypothetical protein